ncbi:MAG: hypothetical protein EHM55_09580, partial [Acidobacteria bacterium]
MILEDLQWSDHATVELLARIARREERARLLVIGTYRVHDLVHAHQPLWRPRHELGMHLQCDEIALPLLSEQAVAAYLSARGRWNDVEQAARWFLARTEGNPLFLDHLMSWLDESSHITHRSGVWCFDEQDLADAPMPPTLHHLVEVGLSRLSPDEQGLLEIGSVAGLRFPAALVAAAASTSVEHV